MHQMSDWRDGPFLPMKYRKTMVNVLADPDSVVFLAKDRDGISGMLIGMADTFLWSRERYASDIVFVARRGGDQLIEAFRAWAREMRCDFIYMGDSTAADQEVKERFYRRHGMTPKGRVYMEKLS